MYQRFARWMAFMLCVCSVGVKAQNIQGAIVDLNTGEPITDARIQNVFLNTGVNSDKDGHFALAVEKGQLIEFSKPGYKTEKVRIKPGIIPPYFKIFLKKGSVDQLPAYLAQNSRDWKTDSMKYRDLYAHELGIPKLSTFGSIEHPFSALSKKNRQIWAFQDEYASFEKEKYIDYTFNADVISKLTGLTGDSVAVYQKMFRPRYEQLRNMQEFEFYRYILRTVKLYRSGYDPKHPPSRGAQ
ncbi:carboxypeptidase-like regulatory domain-containing protein [Chitinophagaceae bacterium MMS25-I14]